MRMNFEKGLNVTLKQKEGHKVWLSSKNISKTRSSIKLEHRLLEPLLSLSLYQPGNTSYD